MLACLDLCTDMMQVTAAEENSGSFLMCMCYFCQQWHVGSKNLLQQYYFIYKLLNWECLPMQVDLYLAVKQLFRFVAAAISFSCVVAFVV